MDEEKKLRLEKIALEIQCEMVGTAADTYRKDPINILDRPSSWMNLDRLLEACDKARARARELR